MLDTIIDNTIFNLIFFCSILNWKFQFSLEYIRYVLLITIPNLIHLDH